MIRAKNQKDIPEKSIEKTFRYSRSVDSIGFSGSGEAAPETPPPPQGTPRGGNNLDPPPPVLVPPGVPVSAENGTVTRYAEPSRVTPPDHNALHTDHNALRRHQAALRQKAYRDRKREAARNEAFVGCAVPCHPGHLVGLDG